jgi:hypothetical protein
MEPDALRGVTVQSGRDWSILHDAPRHEGRLHFETDRFRTVGSEKHATAGARWRAGRICGGNSTT